MILSLDIETFDAFLSRGQKPEDFEEQNPGIEYVGHFSDENIRRARIGSLAVIEADNKIAPRIFHAENAKELQPLINHAELVLTYNGLRFDGEILYEYGVLIPPFKHLDLAAEQYKVTRRRISLEALAQANLNIGKCGNGALAPVHLQSRNHLKIIGVCDYNLGDCFLVVALWRLACEQGYLLNPIDGTRIPLSLKREAGLFQ